MTGVCPEWHGKTKKQAPNSSLKNWGKFLRWGGIRFKCGEILRRNLGGNGGDRAFHLEEASMWKTKQFREFSGSAVVRTLCFHCRGTGSIPGQGTKILHAMQQGKKRHNSSVWGDDKKTWKWTVVMVTQYCECTWCHWIVHFLNGKKKKNYVRLSTIKKKKTHIRLPW